MARGPGAEREFRNQRPAGRDLAGKRAMESWIDQIDTAAEDGNGVAPRFKRTTVRCSIDATGKPAGDDQSSARQISGNIPGDLASRRGRPPTAHHGKLG